MKKMGMYNELIMIYLDKNENPHGPGQMVQKALYDSITQVSRYPDMEGVSLKKALAEHYDLTPEQFTLSNGSGSVSLLILIAEQFTSENDKIILSENGFIHFIFNKFKKIGTFQRQCVIIPRINNHHDLSEIANAVTKNTKLIFIENPDNPSGTWISHKDLEKFLAAIPNNVIVVSDEAYYEYARYALHDEFPDTIALQKKYTNLITLRTFSKAYGLAGLRVAYAISSSEIRDILNKKWIRRSVTSPALIAACAALKDKKHLEYVLENNAFGMTYIENSFEKMNIDYIPSVTNFITFNAGKNAKIVYEKLVEKEIYINSLDFYNLPSKLRVTVGLDEENRMFIKNLMNLHKI
ncbi:histidinol-phosphate aminotransferase [Candidatus Magnetomorum sp. HK-1]|nr:histidinol-phosphate aminotransferase [Candidatus Magnetomorum sp. HK-1]